MVEIERQMIGSPRNRGPAFAPVEPARDHEVDHEVEVLFEAQDYPLGDSLRSKDALPADRGNRDLPASDEKRRDETDGLDGSAHDEALEGVNVRGEIRQFGHAAYFESGSARGFRANVSPQ